jgi:hypothetical protein
MTHRDRAFLIVGLLLGLIIGVCTAPWLLG